MLFSQLAAVFLGSVAMGAAAGPLFSGDGHDSLKREVPSSHRLHERSLPHWKAKWTKRRKVSSDTLLPMRIGLKQSNLEHAHNLLMDISNPTSPHFGKHLSAEEVIEMFAPHEDSVGAVKSWLTSAGISSDRITLSVNKQWIQFDAHTHEVEELLVTDYFIYEHGATGTQNIACDEYHLPKQVQKHVDYITPGIRLRTNPALRKRAQELKKREVQSGGKIAEVIAEPKLPKLVPLNSSVCYQYATPECVRTQYGIPRGSKAAKGNELGIFASLNSHYSKEDLDVYFSSIYPAVPNGTYPTDKLIDGAIGEAQNPSQISPESALDLQASIPLIYPQGTIMFQTDDQVYEISQNNISTQYPGFWNTFYDALDGSYCTSSAFGETGNCDRPECRDPSYPNPDPAGYQGQLQCGVYKPTNVISVSYGGGEGDLPGSYSKRQCQEILKLGLQGVSVVTASGDDGVGSYSGDFGYKNGCAGPDGTIFYPTVDASCPYILTVGATQLDNSTANPLPGRPLVERATVRFASGGGFSNVFDMPEYQKQAVDNYFATVNLNFTSYTDPGVNFTSVGNGVFRRGGRAYPDVSAIGDRYIIRANRTWYSIGGSSLSTPVWASMLTLVNEERIAQGKKTVGFINPILYAHPEVFNDVTEGSNPSCKSSGFLAAKGWDPVTGLGSPRFPKLLSLLMSLP